MARIFEMNVWNQLGYDTISRKVFYAVIGGILTWGFILTAIIATLAMDSYFNTLEIILIGVGIPIVGILLSVLSHNPTFHFLDLIL